GTSTGLTSTALTSTTSSTTSSETSTASSSTPGTSTGVTSTPLTSTVASTTSAETSTASSTTPGTSTGLTSTPVTSTVSSTTSSGTSTASTSTSGTSTALTSIPLTSTLASTTSAETSTASSTTPGTSTGLTTTPITSTATSTTSPETSTASSTTPGTSTGFTSTPASSSTASITSGLTSSPSTTTETTSTGVTSTTTTPTTTTTTTVPPVVCQNGGTYDTIKCLCLPDFYGPLCEFSSDSITTDIPIEGTVVANVELVVTVTNFNYTEELQDPYSEAYERFVRHFRQEMAKIYSPVPGYEGVKILSIRPATSSKGGARVRRASVSLPVGTGLEVEHEVIFSTTASPDLSEEFQNKTQELVQKLRETADSQGDCNHNLTVVCLVVSSSPVVKNMTESPSLDALCQQRAPVGYQDYYYALNLSSTVRCVTNCTANTPITLDCYHGQCHVTRAGPQCFCWDESLYWYTGSQCSGRVSKVATGLGVVATVLLVACIVFVVLLVKKRKEWR
ncbi:mucin-17-like, partial [Oxyura jamaicensis]|uniref:mucin-17-like n=1 Tax=Oxyura jamaicensis TaxID=8884 RepID=UPI0015A50ED7